MSTSDQPVTDPTDTPEPVEWADRDAIFAAAHWFGTTAPAELIERYRGMHVAILGEQIIDADRDFAVLGRRLEAQGDAIPMRKLCFRYIPTEEEAMRGRY
jgi:hypothetical protein